MFSTHTKVLYFLLSIIFLATLVACASSRDMSIYPAPNGDVINYIHSAPLEGPDHHVDMDFTVLESNHAFLNITSNFSLKLSSNAESSFTNFSFELANGTSVSMVDVKTIYADANKKTIRFTGQISPTDFQLLLDSPKLLFIAKNNNTAVHFTPSSEFNTSLAKANTQFKFGRN